MDNYGGVFDCFYPGRVMVGDFTADDIYKVDKVICNDFVEQFIRQGRVNERHIVGEI